MRNLTTVLFMMITLGLSAQNVGIGTLNPINRLHIKVDTAGILPILRLRNAHNDGDASILLRAAQSHYSFGIDGVAAFKEAAEEACEAIDDNPELLKTEASDLLYHFVVLLTAKDIPLVDVLEILKNRRR